MTKQKTKAAERVLDRITGKNPKLNRLIKAQHLNLRIAEMIHAAREDAGLTQTALAKLVGTTQSVISRLEDADYTGHSLTVLERIACALGQKLEVRMVPDSAKARARWA